MSFIDFLPLLVGPAGGVVFSVLASWLLWHRLARSSSELTASLESSRAQLDHALAQTKAELQSLYREEIDRLRRERDDLARRLEREHAERLLDAKAQAAELLESARMNAQIAQAILAKRSTPPPGPSSLPTPPTSRRTTDQPR